MNAPSTRNIAVRDNLSRQAEQLRSLLLLLCSGGTNAFNDIHAIHQSNIIWLAFTLADGITQSIDTLERVEHREP